MRKIPLTQGQFTLVDDANFDWLNQWTWHFLKSPKDRCGYARRNSEIAPDKRGAVLMHRLIIGAKPGEIVDHINGDSLDNRCENLRLVDTYQSACNKPVQKNARYKRKGVTRVRDRKGRPAYWIARVSWQGKRYYLGIFPTLKAAAEAYEKAAKELQGEFARGLQDPALEPSA